MINSVLYRPIVLSMRALSYASPTDPIDAVTPAASRCSAGLKPVYWLPASLRCKNS